MEYSPTLTSTTDLSLISFLLTIFTNPFIVFLLIIFFFSSFLFVLFFLIRKLLHRSTKIPVAFRQVVLLVTLPKESSKEHQKEERHKTQEAIKEGIAVAETFFTSIGGMRAERGILPILFGRSDHLALEIVADEGLISFYLSVPQYLERYIEQQIQAQYPESQVERVEDYNIFEPQGAILGSYLKLKRPYIFPIKTYKKIETDPLNALTNVLSKLEPKDGAAIQLVVRSAKKRWHRWGVRVASEMQQGKKIRKALKTGTTWGKVLKVGGEVKEVVIPKSGEQLKREEKGLSRTTETGYRLSPMEEELVKGLEEKTSKAGLEVNMRVVVSSSDRKMAQLYLNNILNTFSQYNLYEYGNSFKVVKPKTIWSKNRLIHNFIYRHFVFNKRMILNTEELATLYHFPLPSTETPNIRWLLAKKSAAPVNLPPEGILLGKNIYRGTETEVRIKREDRRRHFYMVGMTGVGKSVLMANMAIQDIKNGEGVAVLDPHGSLVEEVLAHIPKERVDDVIYFDPSDVKRPIGLNMLEADNPQEMDFVNQEMIAIFYKLVTDPSMIGPVFEHNMRNAMLTLMSDKESPGTIVEIPRLFTDADFQKYKLTKLKDPLVRAFWEKEMAKTTDFHKSEMLGYLISKVGRFVENEMMRNIIGQPRSGFNFREIMDSRKILLVNLCKGKIGEVNANLLGLILVSKLQMAAFARAELSEEKRYDFYLYMDEFQNFITDSIATILAEARKYRLNLIIAHQYLGQLVFGAGVEGKAQNTRIRDAVFGNVGSLVCFRIGPEDAEFLAKQFVPVFNEYDLINIAKYNAYVKLLIDNAPSRPFNLETLPPTMGDPLIASSVKTMSRLKYGRDREEVEEEILERSRLGGSCD